jgi:hypothetical protein
MFISKYSAEKYYKAVDGPKEEHWHFTNHEFNDAQSRHDRREWLTTKLGLHRRSPPIHLTQIRPCGRWIFPGLMGLWSDGRQSFPYRIMEG